MIRKILRRYKFDINERYATNSAVEYIPEPVRMLLWEKIDDRIAKKKRLDSVQAFEFEVGEDIKITHSQKRPSYVAKHRYPLIESLKYLDQKRVLVIDAITHCTMQLARENEEKR